jgi:hypothetical protein
MKQRRFVHRSLITFGIALAIITLLNEQGFAWNGNTHNWIITQALKYLKQQKNVSLPVDFEANVKYGAGYYADNTGKEVKAGCHLLLIPFLGAERGWDLDGLKHFLIPDEQIEIHASGWNLPSISPGDSYSVKDAFAYTAQSRFLCGNIVRTGEAAAPQYAGQLFNRALELYPGGKKELDLKRLSNLEVPPAYQGMVNTDGDTPFDYVKKRFYAGWNQGTDPKSIWPITSCSSIAAFFLSVDCNFSGVEEKWCCECCSICSESCASTGSPNWPTLLWKSNLESKETSFSYLGWAIHMVEDSTEVDHILMDHGEPHQAFEKYVDGKEDIIAPGLPLPAGEKICIPSIYGNCQLYYSAAPDYIDALIPGSTFPGEFWNTDIENFVKDVAGFLKTQYDANKLWASRYSPQFTKLALDAAVKAAAAVIYRYMWDVESSALPDFDNLEPSDCEFQVKTINFPGKYYNLSFHDKYDIDCYKFTIPEGYIHPLSDLEIRIEYDDPGGFDVLPPFPFKNSIWLEGPNGKIHYPVDQKKSTFILKPVVPGDYLLHLEANRAMYYNLVIESGLAPDITEGTGFSSYDILKNSTEFFGAFNIHDMTDSEDVFRIDFDDFQFKAFKDCIDEYISVEINYDPAYGDIKLYVDFGEGYVEIDPFLKLSTVLPVSAQKPPGLPPGSHIDAMIGSMLATSESLGNSAISAFDVVPYVRKKLRTKKTANCILYWTPEAIKPVYIKVTGDRVNTYTLHVKRQSGPTVASCTSRCPNIPPGVDPKDYFGGTGASGSSGDYDIDPGSLEVVSRIGPGGSSSETKAVSLTGNLHSFSLIENNISIGPGFSFILPLGYTGEEDCYVCDPANLLPFTDYFIIGSNSEGTELFLSANDDTLAGKYFEEIFDITLDPGSLSDPFVMETIKLIIASREDLLTPYGSFATLYAIPLEGPARTAGLFGINRYGEPSPPADPTAMLATDASNPTLTKPVANLTYRWEEGYGKMPVTFDASASYNPLSEIFQYEWDWNGDGVFDETTNGPIVQHSWEGPFISEVRVRVTGGGTETERVNVSYDPNFQGIGTFFTGLGDEYVREFGIPVDSNMNRVVFSASVADDLAAPDVTGPLGLTLLTPDGYVISPSTYDEGYESAPDFEAYNIERPAPGIWRMRLSEETTIPAVLGVIGETSADDGGVSLLVSVDKQIATVNELLTLRAELMESLRVPVLEAKVTASIETPSAMYSLRLYDDGNHRDGSANDGIYGNVFEATSEPGRYTFMVTASGAGSSGLEFLRSAFTGTQVNLLPDNDGMPDDWEERYGLDKYKDDTMLDDDGDGLTNLDEYLHGTHPGLQDTDRDGYGDGKEVALGTRPLDPFDFPQDPVPDIKVNNMDTPLTLVHSDTLNISVSINNYGRTDNADWWFAAATPVGIFLLTQEGWTTDILPAYQGPLFYVPPFELFNVPLSGFPVGTYTFYFGVDTEMDGEITWDRLYYDFAVFDLGNVTIESLKGPEGSNYIGRKVTIEGIFVSDSLPMLVTDLERVKENSPIPDDQYIVLMGNKAGEIDPGEYGGARLKLTGVVHALEGADEASEYMGEYVGIEVLSYEFIERLEIYNPEIVHFTIHPTFSQPNRYAILFSGGSSPADNHVRYWNDLKFMYSTLINKYGYPAENIAVLYANGKGRDNQMPVHYSATQANLETVFTLLREVSTEDDSIFMFTTNHGGGFKKADPAKKYIKGGQLDGDGDEMGDILFEKDYDLDLNGNGSKIDQVSWDEELVAWGGSIFDDAFHTILSNLNYDRMIIVMEQCYSGGLIADMAQGGSNRIIMSAAGEYEPSWSMPPSNDYDEFSFHFTSAINGSDPDGKTVDADTDNDGEVSMVEAFNYAIQKDTASETSWYEDSGDGIPHSGSMPGGGEGTLGSNTSL